MKKVAEFLNMAGIYRDTEWDEYLGKMHLTLLTCGRSNGYEL